MVNTWFWAQPGRCASWVALSISKPNVLLLNSTQPLNSRTSFWSFTRSLISLCSQLHQKSPLGLQGHDWALQKLPWHFATIRIRIHLSHLAVVYYSPKRILFYRGQISADSSSLDQFGKLSKKIGIGFATLPPWNTRLGFAEMYFVYVFW